MLKTIRKLADLFSNAELWKLGGILGVTVVMALVEVTGIASIMPFMAVLADPGIVQENRWLSLVYGRLGFDSVAAFNFFLGVVVLFLLLFTIGLSAFTFWLMLHFSAGINYRLSVRLLENYLKAPYEFFLETNTAALSKNILAEVGSLSYGVLFPMMQVAAKAVVTLLIFALLFAVDPLLSMSVGVGLGGLYALIYSLMKRRLRALGVARLKANTERYKSVNEALGGIKDIKVLGREDKFLQRFSEPSYRFVRYVILNQLMGQMPKYALEAIAFGGMTLIVLYLMATSSGLDAALPVMSIFALAAYRLLPSLQMIFRSTTQIRFSLPVLETLHGELRVRSSATLDPRPAPPGTLSFEKEIALRDITYEYSAGDRPAVSNLNLAIPRNSTIAFVGPTGSGKTTTVDIIMGLLWPQRGCVAVDGVPVTPANVRAWQRKIGYVPQQIFLCDDTITRNIAFGIPDDEIDMDCVRRASDLAQLMEFIERLPDRFESMVGERGIRLSGGQMQRIGIARALYQGPEVLVFDEATSAIDSITETGVMDGIRELSEYTTIVIIAHRISTVQECDVIYMLESGRMVRSGTYDELVRCSEDFRQLAKVETF